jgi:hypothetical protein
MNGDGARVGSHVPGARGAAAGWPGCANLFHPGRRPMRSDEGDDRHYNRCAGIDGGPRSKDTVTRRFPQSGPDARVLVAAPMEA